MASLSGPFKIDRTDPPQGFYTPRRGKRPYGAISGVTVFAISGIHERSDFVTVGYVCRQTPFGQGTSLGVRSCDLRRARPDEIRLALLNDHPHGPQFRPGCDELNNAAFHLATSNKTGPQSRTADKTRHESKPVLPVTRKQMSSSEEQVARQYRQIMAYWEKIAKQQAHAIRATLG
jgi:hypothetical protein